MKIIINADDYGFNKSCTDAICEAFSKRLITDTTMMANTDAFDYAVKRMKEENLNGKIGVHFNLTEGVPLTEGIKKIHAFVEDGVFRCKLRKFRFKPLSKTEKRYVYEELTAQIERIEKSGIQVSHADSHHHVHVAAFFVTPIVLQVCKEHGIDKIRLYRNYGDMPFTKSILKNRINSKLIRSGFKTTKYFGSFNDIEKYGLKDGLEIMTHPDFDSSGILIDRADVENGQPFGKPLADLLSQLQNETLISYGEL